VAQAFKRNAEEKPIGRLCDMQNSNRVDTRAAQI